MHGFRNEDNLVFIGRDKELTLLKDEYESKKCSLVVMLGRRRIGKSTLIKEFAKNYPVFIEIAGLAPFPDHSHTNLKTVQLNHFSKQIARQFKTDPVLFLEWDDAFLYLANLVRNKRAIVLLDEISWMGHGDPSFTSTLKNAWDQYFKKSSHLVLIICGSVSSWISDNILNSTQFLGRISLEIHLKELKLNEIKDFWGSYYKKTSEREIAELLSITGGVPYYLELMDFRKSSAQLIFEKCFQDSGVLFNEFERIFSDTFSRKAITYREIVECLISGKKSLTEICSALRVSTSGVYAYYLNDLCIAGFITSSESWDIKTGLAKRKNKIFRISDCYLRFYLKFIAPKKAQIQKKLFQITSMSEFKEWPTILGLQFETLILNNLDLVVNILKIPGHEIVNAGPFVQKQTTRSKACQIDLLVQTKKTFYVCEIKCRKMIGSMVDEDIKNKIVNLKIPKGYSARGVLIYCGELSEDLETAENIDYKISLTELMNYC